MEIKNFVISKLFAQCKILQPLLLKEEDFILLFNSFAPNRFCSMTHHPLKTNTLRPNAHNYVSKSFTFTETRTIKIAGLSPTREQK